MAISTQPKNQSIASPLAGFGRFVPRISGRLGATFLLILASTLVPSVIILWLDGRPKPLKEFFITPFISLVYSICIGGLLSIGLNLFLRGFLDKSPLIKFLYLTVLIAAATLIGFFLGSSILLGFNALIGFSYFGVDWGTWRISLFMGLLFGVIMFAVDSLKFKLEKTELELRTKQLSEARAKNLVTEAQLSSLESRVRPHFLFNTLNSISALIREEPEKAERTVERLAALLRFSLDAANQKTVAIREEIRVVRDYLEIEKTRFGERLKFSFDVEDAAEDFKIPPFAVQTLVENSIKHHISKRNAGGEIRVSAQIGKNFFRLEVWDDGAGFDESDISENHGLENLQARLSALYGEAATLKIERRDRFTVVSINISATETK
jgi:sensor histidine kinase YesM